MSAQHFLVPVDFSPCSDETLAYAITLATQLQARLTLLHVLPELALGVGPPPAALPALVSYLHDLEAKVQQELDAHLTQIQEAGLQGDTVLVHGVPSQGILDTARDQHVDLIIMGTHGRTRAHQVVVGLEQGMDGEVVGVQQVDGIGCLFFHGRYRGLRL